MVDEDHRQTLLIVDDEPENLAVLGRVLGRTYRVRVANGGARGLIAANSDPRPDLILLDVMMPELNGYAVLEQLQHLPSTREIPVIFVTGLGDSVDEEHGLQLGAVDYIAKPIKPAVVRARVRTHLALKHARDLLTHQNVNLELEVQRRTHENEFIQDVSLSVIAGLVETRDLETGNHTMRTRAYVEVIATRLYENGNHALTPVTLARLIKAAPLHDIGKIGIPDRILLKPGPLTSEEFEIMKGHAQIGSDAIGHALDRVMVLVGPDGSATDTLAFLETTKQIARWHHERWDGTGYPDRLAGEAIPIGARIMAIADVFDALTSRRSYKAAMLAPQAIELVLAGKGTQFDPAVVEAFASVRDEITRISRRDDAAAIQHGRPTSTGV